MIQGRLSRGGSAKLSPACEQAPVTQLSRRRNKGERVRAACGLGLVQPRLEKNLEVRRVYLGRVGRWESGMSLGPSLKAKDCECKRDVGSCAFSTAALQEER